MGTAVTQEHVGMNRTGIQMSPLDARAMQTADPAMLPTPNGGEASLGAIRNDYIANADALGSVPCRAP